MQETTLKFTNTLITFSNPKTPSFLRLKPPPCSSTPLTFLPPKPPKIAHLPPPPPPPLPSSHHNHNPLPVISPTPDPDPEFESKVLFLDSIGLDSLSLPLLTTAPIHAAFSTSSLDDVKSLFNYLSSFGLHGPDLRRVVSMCPDLLSFRLTDVAPVFTFLLREVNVPLDHLPRVIRRRPRLLACHVDTRLRPTLYFLQSIGIHEVSRYTNLLSSSVEDKFIPKIDYFQKLGFSYRDSISMFRRFPALFCYSVKDNFEPKLNYFVVEMGRDLKELKEFPHYFSFSLERRIKPRHQSCVENGICLPLPVMLKMKEDLFLQKLDVCCNSSMPRSTSPLWSANNYDVNTM